MPDAPLSQQSLAGLLDSPNESLLDLVDSLLDKGGSQQFEIGLRYNLASAIER